MKQNKNKLNHDILVNKLKAHTRGAYDKFPAFFRRGTFIDSTYMKL